MSQKKNLRILSVIWDALIRKWSSRNEQAHITPRRLPITNWVKIFWRARWARVQWGTERQVESDERLYQWYLLSLPVLTLYQHLMVALSLPWWSRFSISGICCGIGSDCAKSEVFCMSPTCHRLDYLTLRHCYNRHRLFASPTIVATLHNVSAIS